MATAPSSGAPGGSPVHGLAHGVGRVLVVPFSVGALVLIVAGVLGYPMVGLFITVGLVLGAINGVSAQLATNRLMAGSELTRGMIVQKSLRRLFAITAAALLIAWLARPTGWTVLLGLAIYQMFFLGSSLGAAMREVRGG